MNLVTGGTGLVGSHLILDLLKEKRPVRVLIRDFGKKELLSKVFSWYHPQPDELLRSIDWVKGDITDLGSLEEAFEGVRDVYHCAAFVSFQNFHGKVMREVNVGGTANMVNLALEKGIRKFCHVSSVAAFGDQPEDKIITEQNTWKGASKNNHYSLTKYAGEREVWRGIEEGLNAVIVNPSAIIGPGDWEHGTPMIFRKASKGIIFFPPGSKNYVDVRDVTKIMVQLMKSDISRERFILAAESYSIREFMNQMAVAFGQKPPTRRIGRRWMNVLFFFERIISLFSGRVAELTPVLVRALCSKPVYSSEKVKKALNYSFIPMKESLEHIAKIYKNDTKRS